MKHLKHILFAGLLMFSLPSLAQTPVNHYVCPCEAGAHASCPPNLGNDATANSQDPATPRQWISNSWFQSLPAGAFINVCQGGAKTNVSLNLFNPNATPTAPITIRTYAASWGGAGIEPIVTRSSSGSIFAFGDQSMLDGGYTITGLRVDGQHAASQCFQLYNTANRNIRIIDNTITGCAFGINLEAMNEQDISPNQDVVIEGNRINGNHDIGIYGAMNRGSISRNVFYRNGNGTPLTHHIYLGYRGRAVTIAHNEFSAAGQAWDSVSDECIAGNITVHGKWNDLHIVGNRIINSSRSYACAGIKINTGYGGGRTEWFDDVVMDSNLIVNTFVAIGMGAAHRPLAVNNTIVDAGTAFNIADTAIEAGETPDFGGKFIGNTIVLSHPGDGLTAFNFTTNHGAGNGLIVQDNLIRFRTGSNTKTCFQHGALANFDFFRRNSCSNEGGGTFRWSPTYATLAAAQAAGFDLNGQDSDPLLTIPTAANDWSIALGVGSPARGAGTGCHRVTYTGRTRTDCSIGAWQTVDP